MAYAVAMATQGIRRIVTFWTKYSNTTQDIINMNPLLALVEVPSLNCTLKYSTHKKLIITYI